MAPNAPRPGADPVCAECGEPWTSGVNGICGHCQQLICDFACFARHRPHCPSGVALRAAPEEAAWIRSGRTLWTLPLSEVGAALREAEARKEVSSRKGAMAQSGPAPKEPAETSGTALREAGWLRGGRWPGVLHLMGCPRKRPRAQAMAQSGLATKEPGEVPPDEVDKQLQAAKTNTTAALGALDGAGAP